MAATKDPLVNYRFVVEINGIKGSFSEVTGLETEAPPIEYREGGDFLVRKLIGLARYGNIRLSRGITKNNDVQGWHKHILEGQNDRRDGIISLLDETNTPVVRWKFFNAWPTKGGGPHLNAEGNEVAIETIELCIDRLEREI